MGLYGLTNSRTRVKENILTYNRSTWDMTHNECLENDVFFTGDTRSYIEEIITTSFTDNADAIPHVDLNITEFIIVHISNLYIGKDELSDNKGNIPPDYIDYQGYKDALVELSDSYFLNSVGFLYINKTKDGKIKFQAIRPDSIVYDWNFTKVCVKVASYEIGKNTYEYYEKQPDGSCRVAMFTANDYFDAGEEPFSLSKEERARINFIELGSFKAMPIVPLFKNRERVGYLSPIVRLHKFLSVIIGFALAGIPMSVFIKLILKTAGDSNKDIKEGFADMMNLLNIGSEDSLEKLNTGDGEAFMNFIKIMEALIGMTGQLLGLPKSSVGSGIKEVRKSGASKYQDNLPAFNFRRRRIMKFNRFERDVFEVIHKIFPKTANFDFRPIDKDNEGLIFDPETLQSYLIEGVKAGLIPFVDAVAVKYGITPADAKSLADKARKEYKEYKELISGSEPNKVVGGGINKSNLKDKNFNREEEDDGDSKSE